MGAPAARWAYRCCLSVAAALLLFPWLDGTRAAMAAVADLWTWRVTGRDRLVDGGSRTGGTRRGGTGASLDTPSHGVPYFDCGHLDRAVSSCTGWGRNPDAAPACTELRGDPGLTGRADCARRSSGRAQ